MMNSREGIDTRQSVLGERLPLQHVRFTADSLQTNRAYWVKITNREDENSPATIKARIVDNNFYCEAELPSWNAFVCSSPLDNPHLSTNKCESGKFTPSASAEYTKVFVDVDNVQSYELDLSSAPVNSRLPVRIYEDGIFIEEVKGPFYHREVNPPRKYKYRKNGTICGPIHDAFTEPYLVVYDDMDTEAKTIEGYRKIAQEVFPNAPMIPGSQLHDLFMKDYNLICMGKFTKHGTLAKCLSGLPARVRDKEICALGRNYSGDIGLCLVYPNPRWPDYVPFIVEGLVAAHRTHLIRPFSDFQSDPFLRVHPGMLLTARAGERP